MKLVDRPTKGYELGILHSVSFTTPKCPSSPSPRSVTLHESVENLYMFLLVKREGAVRPMAFQPIASSSPLTTAQSGSRMLAPLSRGRESRKFAGISSADMSGPKIIVPCYLSPWNLLLTGPKDSYSQPVAWGFPPGPCTEPGALKDSHLTCPWRLTPRRP